jgi:hypothetical protein
MLGILGSWPLMTVCRRHNLSWEDGWRTGWETEAFLLRFWLYPSSLIRLQTTHTCYTERRNRGKEGPVAKYDNTLSTYGADTHKPNHFPI